MIRRTTTTAAAAAAHQDTAIQYVFSISKMIRRTTTTTTEAAAVRFENVPFHLFPPSSFSIASAAALRSSSRKISQSPSQRMKNSVSSKYFTRCTSPAGVKRKSPSSNSYASPLVRFHTFFLPFITNKS